MTVVHAHTASDLLALLRQGGVAVGRRGVCDTL